MKKIYAVLIAIVLLSGYIVTAVSADINSECDQVKITEKVVLGEKSVAEGINITTKNHLKYHLYWETDYTIGKEKSINTEYSFYPRQHYDEQQKSNYIGMIFDNGLEYGFYEDIPASKQFGLQRAYKELYDSAEYNKEKTKTVYIKDYYDYYPLGIGFDLPNTDWVDYEYGGALKGEPYDSLYVTEKFREYFKIPVLESDRVKISVEKYDDNSYSTGTAEDFVFNLNAISAVSYSKNRCFFAINNYKYADWQNDTDVIEYIDTSLIPGGYGIYSFYYYGGDNAERTGIMADTLETVYPLQKEAEVMHLSLNADETKLLLFTEENGASYLTVIDIKTMSEIQKILILDERLGAVYEYDDFFVADMENSISIISVKDDTYSLDYSVYKSKDIDENHRELWNVDCMDYKDGKLALIGNSIEPETGYTLCDFYVCVYDKSGLIYYGVYDNSLDINRYGNDYGYNCHPVDINPNKIEWK